jgi:hypothetical protein
MSTNIDSAGRGSSIGGKYDESNFNRFNSASTCFANAPVELRMLAPHRDY